MFAARQGNIEAALALLDRGGALKVENEIKQSNLKCTLAVKKGGSFDNFAINFVKFVINFSFFYFELFHQCLVSFFEHNNDDENNNNKNKNENNMALLMRSIMYPINVMLIMLIDRHTV